MGCRGGGYGAVFAKRIRALGLHGQDKSKTSIIADDSTVSGFDDVAVYI